MKIDIKPLSVNKCWQGRRFKTPEYKIYENKIFSLLKPINIPKGKIHLFIEVGFSSKASDLDNVCKPFQDILSKFYDFNDNMIYKLSMRKKDVKKGSEFINFEIYEYSDIDKLLYENLF